MSNEMPHERLGLIRRFVRWCVHFYYPSVEIVDQQRISQSKPILICANHANSLVDPVIIGIAARRPVRFLAKAPLFKHPILGPPMNALGMLPAFRASDDAARVRQNLESLEVAARALADGAAMGIFPEGKSTDQAHLEMIRSGAARMAVQAVEHGADQLELVPLGITYQQKERFRSAVLVRVADPIDVQQVLRDQNGDVRKARRALTSQLESRLRDVVVHLDEPRWEPWLDDLDTLAPLSAGPDQACDLQQRKRYADAINYFLAHDRERAAGVAQQIEAHRNQVQAAGLTVSSPVLRMSGWRVAARLLWSFLGLLLWLVPAMLGTLQLIIPFVVVRAVASWMDQPGRKTISTHRLLVGVPFYLVWYALIACVLLAYDIRWAWAWLAATPFTGLIAIYYWRHAGRTARLLYHQLRAVTARATLKRLREQRVRLQCRLSELAEDYASRNA